MRAKLFASLLVLSALFIRPLSCPEFFALEPTALAADAGINEGKEPKPVKLTGRAEVEEQGKDPRMEAWQADVNYRRGAMALQYNDLRNAIEFFRLAAEGWDSVPGQGKFVAQARFAQAQCARLDNQTGEAQRLFRAAVDLFKKYDPTNPYLKAGQGYLDDLSKGVPLKGKVASVQLKGEAVKSEAAFDTAKLLPPIEGRLDSVDRHVQLQGKTAQLVSGLKDEEVFAGAKLQSGAAVADLSDKYVKDRIYNGFIKMTCLEFAALGGNYYTAADNYKPLTTDEGKTIIIGATDDTENPGLRLKLNQKDYSVSMFLPGLAKSSRNVLVVTDERHVLAIDPIKEDIWKLVPVFNKNGTADFSWWKLTHEKRKNVPGCVVKPQASPFGRAKVSK